MDKLLQAFLLALCTPVTLGLVIGIVWLLRTPIRQIVSSTGLKKAEVSLSGVAVEFTVENLEQTYLKQRMDPPSSDDIKEVADLVRTFGPLVAGRQILWVDECPENNRLERTTLLKLDIDVQTRRDTESALAELRYQQDRHAQYDLVISDWIRGGKPEGKRLAETIQDEQINVPVIFYFVDNLGPQIPFWEIQKEARAVHAEPTSSPRQLFRWVFAELLYAILRKDKKTWTLPGAT